MFESQSSSVAFSFDGRAPVFLDHFPGEPLVPAFMQVSAVRQHVAQHLEHPLSQVSIRSVKFIRPLLPDEEVVLRLERGARAGVVRFELVRGGDVVTHGDLGIG